MAKLLNKQLCHRVFTPTEFLSTGVRTLWQSTSAELAQEIQILNSPDPSPPTLVAGALAAGVAMSCQQAEATSAVPIPDGVRGE